MAGENSRSAARPGRIFRLLGLYARLDFWQMLRDPRTFFSWAVSDTILSFAGVTGMLLLSERFNGIGNWSKPQILFLLGYAALNGGLLGVFFGYNVAFISRRLGRGQLDHTLIQPQPLWLSLLTEGFSPGVGLPTLLPGVLLLAVALPQLKLTLSFGWWLLFAVNLMASTIVRIAFQFLWGCLAFYSPRGAEEINSDTNELLEQLKNFPLEGLSGFVRAGFLSFLPVGFLAWVPCRALLRITSAPLAGAATPAAALVFTLLALFTFRRGLTHYARVGSQRYSNFGHRG